MNKRDFLTLLAVAPSATLPAVASDLARNELSGWRPIETAPKDGTLVLVYNTLNNGTITSIDGKIAVARYSHQHDGLEESLWEYGTYYSENSKDNQGAYLISATHWMPLPEPPK